MKSLTVCVLLCLLLLGCVTYPEQREFYQKPYPLYASWSHWYFSNFSFSNDNAPTFRDLQLSDEQHWWGKEVILYYSYSPSFEFIDTLEKK